MDTAPKGPHNLAGRRTSILLLHGPAVEKKRNVSRLAQSSSMDSVPRAQPTLRFLFLISTASSSLMAGQFVSLCDELYR